jgi:hypothetical protein
MAKHQVKEAFKVKEGDHIRFTDNRWYEVRYASLEPDGWVHLKLKGDMEIRLKDCTVRPSEELMWHR